MMPAETTKFIKLSNYYKVSNNNIVITVPTKLRKCQDVASKAILENIILRQLLQEKIKDEKDYQEAIEELDGIVQNMNV